MSSAIRKLNYQDYVCFPDDGKRHEIIDRTLKRNLYERVGVREYWIVDPFEHALTQLVLTDGKYVEQSRETIVSVTYLQNVTVDLSQVW